MGSAINLIGKVFGKLTVLSKSETRKAGHVCWNCLCQCGNGVVVAGAALTRAQNNTVSCGCSKSERLKLRHTDERLELEGTSSGFLTYIRDADKSDKKRRFIVCKCACGKEIEVALFRYVDGTSKSCGCLKNKLSADRMTVQRLNPDFLDRQKRAYDSYRKETK